MHLEVMFDYLLSGIDIKLVYSDMPHTWLTQLQTIKILLSN